MLASPISFRLTDDEIRLLDAEAAQRGLSRSECARELLREALSGQESPLEDEVRKLRRQLAKQDEGNVSLFVRIEEMLGELAATLGEIKTVQNGSARSSAVPEADRLHPLREDFATAVCCLLVHAGRVSEPDARSWVEANLLPPGGE